MILPLYRLATTLLGPLIHLVLAVRRSRGKEDPVRFGERLGIPGKPRPEGPLYWLHAASVGEAQSMLPLIDYLLGRDPALHLLFTTGTVSSARIVGDRLPERALHQYVPVDRLSAVRRFLDHWKPDAALWAESEFWPNIISETQARGIPMVLVNGRISPKSFAGWQKAPGLIAHLLRDFDLCLGQTGEDADRLKELGARSHKCVGNLKFASPPLPADEAELQRLRAALAGRPVWLAASTHPGEEEIAAGVHRALRESHPGLLTIIVPRHPDRGAEIEAALANGTLSVTRRAAGAAPAPETDLYIADTMGELGLFFRLADVVFMGKSLVPLGGQNPLEPARLGCAVLHGPHMVNFREMAAAMDAAGAAREVADADALARAVGELLADADARAAMGAKARDYAGSQDRVVEAVAVEIADVLAGRQAASHAPHPA